MNKIAIAMIVLMLSTSSVAGIDISFKKDVLEIGVTANVYNNSYLYVGADSADWAAVGLGYQRFVSQTWKVAGYYEFGLVNDWLMNEVVGVDGVKTKKHRLEFMATKYNQNYSTRFGVKSEFIRNGFTGITVDDANKYSGQFGLARIFKHIYLSGKYEYHYAVERSDMLDFNQGRASEWEISIGGTRPILRLYPFASVSALVPHGIFYGSEDVDYSWTLGARLTF